jgi:aerobic carbon-monoxide dehydrogenase large subunit
MDGPFFGRSLRRLEDARFLTGRGRYIDDIAAADALHLQVVRSPHGHAAIERIDGAAARAVPGMRGLFTAADLAGLGPLPCPFELEMVEPLIVPPRFALARDRVRHVGDPVAFVVADDRAAALDAAERVEVSYRPLPAVVDGRAALAPGAPLLWDQAPGNRAFRFQKGDRAAVDAACAAAAHLVELELVNNRLVVVPIEPRAAIARYDAASDRLHLLLTGQGVHGIRDQLAGPVFGLPPDKLHLSSPDVGGGFGVKNFPYPEYVMLLWAARRLGRPVKWRAEQAEEFVSAAQGRANQTRARLALDADGRFRALDVATVADLGAYLSSNGPGSSTRAPSTAMGGVYAIPAIFMDVRGAFTNTVPIDAYRGAGKPEANYIIERLIDAAARRLGVDAAALRRQNLMRDFPHRSALGQLIEGGRMVENLDLAVAQADRAGLAARRAAARACGRLRGQGIGCFLETARGQPSENAAVRFRPDGTVALVLGTQSNGQGHETSFPQIAADRLGLPIECFVLVQADSDALPRGGGHGGARSMHMGGGALVKAIDAALAKGCALAAHLLQAAPDTVRFEAGRFVVGESDRAIALLDLARAATDPASLPDGMAPGLDSHADHLTDLFTYPNGCHIAEVEIDPETGAVSLERYIAVDDFGRLVNPLLTAGQVQGGVTQGIGQALLEHTVYEPTSGQLLSGSLMDYALPRADDLPGFEITLAGLPTRANPLGVKGSGQAGCIAAPQTIMNAVLDALAPLGVTALDMPATPERVWRAIRQARGG